MFASGLAVVPALPADVVLSIVLLVNRRGWDRVHASNASTTPIWLPVVSVPRDDNEPGYRNVRLFRDPISFLGDGETITKVVPFHNTDPRRAQIIVRFRDARNVWWSRYVESGQYVAGRKLKRLEIELNTNSQEPGDREEGWPPEVVA